MAVDKKILEQCIQQASDGDAEIAEFLRTRYEKNEAAATKFVAGFMTTPDYTKKTQELAQQRQQFEQQSSQLEALRRQLEVAESEKAGILKDLATHRISTAKAKELMNILQEKYGLTDEDLPGMSDLIQTAKKGKPVDNTDPLDERFSQFEQSLMKKMETKFVTEMTPNLGAMAVIPIIWNEITREHQELTGKPLSYAEQQEILKEAQAGKGGIRDVWEQKYNISGDSGLRQQKRDESLKKQWLSERETQEAAERSKKALEVVTPAQHEIGTGANISTAFQTKFKQYEMDPGKPATPAGDGVPTLTVQNGQHVRQSGDRGPSAAQRAAAKFIERQSTGGYGRKAS